MILNILARRRELASPKKVAMAGPGCRLTVQQREVCSYLRDIAIKSAAIVYMTEPTPNEMQYLTPKDAAELDLEVKEWR